MINLPIDLTNCDQEPIRIPGQIQSHGFLVVLDADNRICYNSENISGFIPGIDKELAGRPVKYLEDFFDDTKKTVLLKQLIYVGKTTGNFDIINPCVVTIADVPYNLIFSLSGNYVLLEFEPVLFDTAIDLQKAIGRSVTLILGDKQLKLLLDNAALEVKNLIQYDRVMIYRFAEDAHGEVVAEAKEESLQPWLGLHYPASDIPSQARELYKLNHTRLIADVEKATSKIITASVETVPLDLSFSQLRAVSPIHIQYLKNMGVVSSFSISLMYKNELWGLIACHNYSPRFIDYKLREASKVVGQILSSALEHRRDEEDHQIYSLFNNNIESIVKSLQADNNIADALMNERVNLLHVSHASGVALFFENNITRIGETPGQEDLEDLIAWAKESVTGSHFKSNHFSSVYPAADKYMDTGGGVFILVLSKELNEYIIWFKPQLLQTIKWAGKPEKTVETDEKGTRHISPRHSFEEWSQTVVGTAAQWSPEETRSILRVKEEIMAAVNLKAGAIRLLNEKLRIAYDALDTFSYTISHDLKNPITAIKSYAQLLQQDPSIADNGQKLLMRIGERADKMNFMINAVLDHSRINRLDIKYERIATGALIKEIINDMDLDDEPDGFLVSIGATPDLMGDPVMISQVFSNLIGNAVKYSRHSRPGKVHIEGKEEGADICYSIKDNGLGIEPADRDQIFVLFNRMDNARNIEGSGVGLAIVKRIVEKHSGKIWVESEIGNGSTFFVKLYGQAALTAS